MIGKGHKVVFFYWYFLCCLSRLLNVLHFPIQSRRGISKFYTGKSKSFTSLSDASSASSVEDLAKPENPYTRKRKNLLAHGNLLDKNRNHHFGINGTGMSKKSANFGRSMLVLEVSINSLESITDEYSNSITSSSSHHLPPLHPQVKRLLGDKSSSSPPRQNSPWRSFSLSDLQKVAGSSPNITGLEPNITGLEVHGRDTDCK